MASVGIMVMIMMMIARASDLLNCASVTQPCAFSSKHPGKQPLLCLLVFQANASTLYRKHTPEFDSALTPTAAVS
jgi:hypothetical protein